VWREPCEWCFLVEPAWAGWGSHFEYYSQLLGERNLIHSSQYVNCTGKCKRRSGGSSPAAYGAGDGGFDCPARAAPPGGAADEPMAFGTRRPPGAGGRKMRRRSRTRWWCTCATTCGPRASSPSGRSRSAAGWRRGKRTDILVTGVARDEVSGPGARAAARHSPHCRKAVTQLPQDCTAWRSPILGARISAAGARPPSTR
jgi:hypothetical protein